MKVVIRRGNESWKVVESSGYNNEDHLQALVAEDPTLVPVADLGVAVPQFIVAVREIALRGSGSLDILAFNALGDMAVMECKLADNPEIRRKVIGQIIEYAAFLNRLDYTELDEIVMRRTGKRLHRLIEEKVGDPDWDAADFQAAVERNLASGRFTLIIVVDRMEETLGVTLEYLNACALRNVSLHALEMCHLADGGVEILIPQVFGSSGERAPTESAKRTWTEEDYLVQAAERMAPEGQERLRRLLEFAKANADRVSWGKGKTGSMSFQIVFQGRPVTVFSLFADGYLVVGYGHIARVADANVAARFRDRLLAVPAFRGADFGEGKFPGCRLGSMEGGLDTFMEAVTGLKGELHAP